MFSLTKFRDRVYMLTFDNSYELCMAFLRYEEFYENLNPRFRGQSFTLAEFMSWYSNSKAFGKGRFTFTDDWGGFNLPANIIKQVHELGIKDPNHYDALMMGVYGMISVEAEDAYLIGVTTIDTANFKEHELTHAMWHVDPEYKKKILKILDDAEKRDPTFMKQVVQALRNEGYVDAVIKDEISAYVSTGENGYFSKVTNKRMMTQLRKDIKAVHAKHFKAFLPAKK